MKYIVIVIVLILLACTSVKEDAKKLKEKNACMLYSRIRNVIRVKGSSNMTDEFKAIKHRILNDEDTVFDMATRDFRILIFINNNISNSTPDTVIVNRIIDKEKSRWEEEW